MAGDTGHLSCRWSTAHFCELFGRPSIPIETYLRRMRLNYRSCEPHQRPPKAKRAAGRLAGSKLQPRYNSGASCAVRSRRKPGQDVRSFGRPLGAYASHRRNVADQVAFGIPRARNRRGSPPRFPARSRIRGRAADAPTRVQRGRARRSSTADFRLSAHVVVSRKSFTASLTAAGPTGNVRSQPSRLVLSGREGDLMVSQQLSGDRHLGPL